MEEPNFSGCVANEWPCACWGPFKRTSTSIYQIDPSWATDSKLGVGGVVYPYAGNQGMPVYQSHGNRFNYAFHDGHVEPLKIEQTVGSGGIGDTGWPDDPNTAAPLGMWTVTPGD